MIPQPIIPTGKGIGTQPAPDKQGEQPYAFDILFGNIEVPLTTTDEVTTPTTKPVDIDAFGKATDGALATSNTIKGDQKEAVNPPTNQVPNSNTGSLPKVNMPVLPQVPKAPIPSVLLKTPQSTGPTPSTNPVANIISIQQTVTRLLDELPTMTKLDVNRHVQKKTPFTDQKNIATTVTPRASSQGPKLTTLPPTVIESPDKVTQEMVLDGKVALPLSATKLHVSGQNAREVENKRVYPVNNRPTSSARVTPQTGRVSRSDQGVKATTKAADRNQTLDVTQPQGEEVGKGLERASKNLFPNKVNFSSTHQTQNGNVSQNTLSTIKVELTPSTPEGKHELTVLPSVEELTRTIKKGVSQSELIVPPTKLMDPVKGLLLSKVAQVSHREVPRLLMLEAIVKALDFMKQPGQVRSNVVIDTGSWGFMDIELQKIAGQTQIHIFVESEKVQGALQSVTPIITENLLAKGVDLSAVEVHVKNSSQQPSSSKQRRKGPRKTWQLKIHTTEKVNLEMNSPTNRYYGYNTIEILA